MNMKSRINNMLSNNTNHNHTNRIREGEEDDPNGDVLAVGSKHTRKGEEIA